MIAIIDYGVGNLFSLQSSFAAIGSEAVVTSDEKVIAAADRLILEIDGLLEKCGLEKGCSLLKVEDYDKLTGMINSDSINYSPARVYSDNEIRVILDQIRRGF